MTRLADVLMAFFAFAGALAIAAIASLVAIDLAAADHNRAAVIVLGVVCIALCVAGFVFCVWIMIDALRAALCD